MSSFEILKSVARMAGVDPGGVYRALSAMSVSAAIREQGLQPICERLRQIVPDISDQFTAGFDRAEYEAYWERKMRGMHAFQVTCVLDALNEIGGENLVLIDIGDSAGTHATYVKAMATPGQVDRIISVNLDPIAVEKVKAKGFEAICCRAEDLNLEGIRADLFLSFETIEHLTDPVRFLHDLAVNGSAEHLLMTVPYRRISRFGGGHMRLPEGRIPEHLTPEEVHIYEFSPEDWLLLTRFAGFRPIFTRTYLQYPRRSPLRLLAPLWRGLDFEGFFAIFLRRDLSLSARYTGW